LSVSPSPAGTFPMSDCCLSAEASFAPIKAAATQAPFCTLRRGFFVRHAGMMDQHEPGTHDWSTWHITIEMLDEGRCDDPFPEPLLGQGEGSAAQAGQNVRAIP
jgi:hypothetical protein